ncbi:hypothetical protein MLD38_035651 [Melastoma candidum]|uniref:Uncharacterized protein n=1 Tax=Melastoma candidum TaxID=119954 RepID=A0ACB9LH83_9MYRT|nr:hypothetical protein MLD38_035651 [Melastoma candidum]
MAARLISGFLRRNRAPTAKLFTTSSPRNPNLVNFSPPSDSEDSDLEDQRPQPRPPLPPPYNPFSTKTKPEPDNTDPSDLQRVFHNIRSDPQALTDYAAKMFDYLSRQGLTHEALSFFSVMKDKGQMPDVIPFTAVIEAYAKAGGGQSRQAEKVWMRMLASGVEPSVYTYEVLVRGMTRDGRAGDAGKYVREMAGKGMRGSAEMWVEVVEGFAAGGREEEGRRLWEEVRGKVGRGFEEGELREAVKGRRGAAARAAMAILAATG